MKAEPPDDGIPHSQSSRHWPWLPGLLLIAATFLAYLPALHNGFIWDDDSYVTKNATLHNLTGLWQIWFKVGAVPQYYPLVHTTFWVEYHLWGLQPSGYHLDNVLLHALAAVLLGCVLKRLQAPGAWLAAAIFALHPVQVESVAWITERKNVLSAVFYFAAALAYLRFDPPDGVEVSHRRRWYFYFGALALFVAALLSKTVTCSLPAALLLVYWWKHRRPPAAGILPLVPFFVIGVLLGLLTVWVEKYHVGAHGTDWSLTFADRCLVAGRALWFYAGKLAWPAPLIFIYPRWHINADIGWQWIFPAAAAGVMIALWFLRNRIGRGPLTGVLFFAVTLSPALGFVNTYPMRYSYVSDHWVYLASVGLIALVVALVVRLAEALRLRRVIYGFALLLLAILGTLTWRQCGMYADVETLWRTTIARNPDCWLAQNNLGTLLLDRGNLDEAIQRFERALKIQPDSADALNNLGGMLAKKGKWDEAIQYYDHALQLKPDDVEVHNNLGIALANQGKPEEAIQHYRRALQFDPDYTEAHNNLAITLASQGKLDEAIRHYDRVLQLKPDYAAAHNNLGIALAGQGKSGEAIQHFERALQLKPDYVEAHYNVGIALADQGKWDEAIRHYERALQLEPDYAEAHNNLGFALANQGKLDEAIEQYKQALGLKPDYPDALINLGNALASQGKLDEAIQHYERSLQLKPDDPEPNNNLGAALARQGKLPEAIRYYERALQLEPDYAEAQCNLGIALAGQGKSAEAISHFQQALALATAQGKTALAKSLRQRLESHPPASPQQQTR